MISNSQSFNEYIENLAEQYEQTEVQQGKILSEIREAYKAQGKDGEGWIDFVATRLQIKRETAYNKIRVYEISNDFSQHVGRSEEPTIRQANELTTFKNEEPNLYKEVLETKPTLEQMLEVARAEQAAFEADTAAHEAQRIKVESTRMDPNESIGYKILSASLDLSLPVNEDKVTGKTLAKYLETHISSPMDTIALSMLRQKLNSAFNIMGID